MSINAVRYWLEMSPGTVTSPPRVNGPVIVTGSRPAPSSAWTPTPSALRASWRGAIGRRRSGGAPSTVTGPVASAATAVTKRDVVPASAASSTIGPAGQAAGGPVHDGVGTRQGDADAEGLQTADHGHGVVAAGHPAQSALAVGQRGAHEGPVGDALRAGHGHHGVERSRRRRQWPRVTPGWGDH